MARTKTGTRPVDLSTTSYAVLGLLTFGEMSGYDLVKLVESSIGFFWTPAKSQVYGELRRLERAGHVREREVEQESRPDKRLYRITRQGETALRHWLDESPLEADVFRSALLVKLFFGSHSQPGTLRSQVEDRLETARQTLARLQEIERQIKDVDAFFYPYLTLRAGLARTRATIRWAEETLRMLERREGS